MAQFMQPIFQNQIDTDGIVPRVVQQMPVLPNGPYYNFLKISYSIHSLRINFAP